MKTCRNCGTLFETRCKKCFNAYQRKWSKYKALGLKVPKKNRPVKEVCNKCGGTDLYTDGHCRACKFEYRKKWYVTNREKQIDKARKNRSDNKEKVRESKRLYYAENREARMAYHKKWLSENPERNRIYLLNRRARKKSSGGKLSPGLAERLLALQKCKCAVCRKSLKDGYHLDHMMPLGLQGRNEDRNMQLLCPHCNQSKHDKHPIDFMQSRGFLL